MKMEDESKKLQQQCEFEYTLDWETSALKTDFLLEEVEGQLSLRIVYWFLVTHGDVVEDSITGNIGIDSPNPEEASANGFQKKALVNPDPNNAPNTGQTKVVVEEKVDRPHRATGERMLRTLKIAPQIRTSFKNVNTIYYFHYVNRYRTFDEVVYYYYCICNS